MTDCVGSINLELPKSSRGTSAPMRDRVSGIALLAFFFAGCAAPSFLQPGHHIAINEDGRPLGHTKDDSGELKRDQVGELKPDQFLKTYVDPIIYGIETYVRERCNASMPPKILLFIHGGLNGYNDGIKHVIQLRNAQTDKTSPYPALSSYYLVSINWEAGLRSALWDYFFEIRAGERNPALATATSPFVFAGAVGQSIVNLPRDMYYAYLRDLWEQGRDLGKGALLGAGLAAFYVGIITAVTNLTFADTILTGVAAAGGLYTLPVLLSDPTRYAFGPIRMVSAPFIDGFGTPAWDMLKRRPDLVLFNPQIFSEHKERGAGHALLKQLAKTLQDGHCITQDGKRISVELTLVGHSMGAMVADRILQAFREDLHFNDIVYMGAADSIADFQLSVVPYLRQRHQSRFWSFSLSDEDETNETYFLDLLMRGSLLVWIEKLFEPQYSLLQRRFGRAASQDYVIIDDVINKEDRIWSRICRVTFSGKNKGEPKEHGDFTNPATLENTLSIVQRGCPQPADINRANEAELRAVPGLPKDDVTRILDHRPYQDKEDLLDKVDQDDREIISDKVYDAIEDYLTPVNINSATVGQLARLLRGDKYLANEICAQREKLVEKQRQYKATEELRNVMPEFIFNQITEQKTVTATAYYREPPECRPEPKGFWLFEGRSRYERSLEIDRKLSAYRKEVLAEIKKSSDIRLISEAEGDPFSQSIEQFWDALLEIGTQRVAVEIYTIAQLRVDGGLYDWRKQDDKARRGYSERVAARAKADKIATVILVWNKDVLGRPGVRELRNLLQQSLAETRLEVIHGSPPEIVSGILAIGKRRQQ